MKRILLVIDVQIDFCPGGSLAVAEGAAIIPGINQLQSSGAFDYIIASQDWHPAGHISFADSHHKKPFETIHVAYGEQVLWPTHCVAGQAGADFHPALDTNRWNMVQRKGCSIAVDSYSAFLENDQKTTTGLDGWIRSVLGKMAPTDLELVIVGIATDVCVLNTAIDAKVKFGFPQVVVLSDLCAGVSAAGTTQALASLTAAGVSCLSAAQWQASTGQWNNGQWQASTGQWNNGQARKGGPA